MIIETVFGCAITELTLGFDGTLGEWRSWVRHRAGFGG